MAYMPKEARGWVIRLVLLFGVSVGVIAWVSTHEPKCTASTEGDRRRASTGYRTYEEQTCRCVPNTSPPICDWHHEP